MSEATRRPGRPRSAGASRPVTLSLPPSLVERLEAARERLTARDGWQRSRSVVGVRALMLGLEALERDAAGSGTPAPGSAA